MTLDLSYKIHFFFAHAGKHSNGHDYITEAIEKGASVIVHTQDLIVYHDSLSYVKVEDIRSAMSFFSHEFYDRPSHKLSVIGVTGTDGKSTSAFYLYQILNKLGRSAGFISTVAYDAGEGIQENPFHQSTPEATEIHALLAQMVESNKEYAIVESTSHGLSLINKRLEDVRFQGALLTNISEEHLDFHGDLDTYVRDKARLFAKASFGMVNADCPFASLFQEQKADCRTYAFKNSQADYAITSLKAEDAGQSFDFVHEGQTYKGFLPVPGIFNVENALGAIALLHWAYGIPLADSLEHVGSLHQLSGRMDLLREGQDFTVLVDYAHTPASFARILPIFRDKTAGRLILIFSHPGERDTKNRPLMGKVADEFGDVIILTEENSRSEDIQKIMRQIADGVLNKTERDRSFLDS